MNLDCLNDIITDNLAIHIDISDLRSWDLNTGFTSVSLTKWTGAISDDLNLLDFGLTGFDNGRTNEMWGGLQLTSDDTLFQMYRIGYNQVQNPTTGQTSGITTTTLFDLYPMSAITGTSGGSYFMLDGGYLQGFFKLKDYNYELFPARCNNGITIETLLYLLPESFGIFFMMGKRAEDKYNPYFSGETLTGITVTGVTTSLDNYLDSFTETTVIKSGFSNVEDNKTIVYSATSTVNNIKDNVIAFLLTGDGHLGYKYINNKGLVVTNVSSAIITNTGFTWITITFTPDEIFEDLDLLECDNQRKGKLVIYVNGRARWIIKDFPEFYCKPLANDKEKQLGVPYSISWGGGSFGLKHSWHYDFQTYGLYTGQDTSYINTDFFVQGDPIPTHCNPIPDDSYLPGLSLSADSTTFINIDECTDDEIPVTVMRIEHTGNTATTYFIKFNRPVIALSNRDYTVNLSLYNDGFFNLLFKNKAYVEVYSDTVDVNIVDVTEYTNGSGWKDLKCVFRTADDSGKQSVNIGLLIETNGSFNLDTPLFVKNFTYTAADILVQDERKNDLIIEQNFNQSFIGGIQKLRIYDKSLNGSEVLHNMIIEARNNPDANFVVSKGGRIIYR
ncbi:MAG: hypothetical protein WC333_01335 [Dehalococcoidia bacterium]|jgi:hypothetical protein